MATRTKHYEAELKDLDQLLQVIESEMGPDAQLETMEYTKGGIMGLGGRRMISITATVEVNPARIGLGTRRTIRLSDNWTAGGGAGEDEPIQVRPREAAQGGDDEKLVDLSRGRAIPRGGEMQAEDARRGRGRTERTSQPTPAPQATEVTAAQSVIETAATTQAQEATTPAARTARVELPSLEELTPLATGPEQEQPDEELVEFAASMDVIREGVERLQVDAEAGAAASSLLEPPAVIPAANARLAEALRQVFDRLVDWNIRSSDALKLIDQAMAHYSQEAEPTADGLFAATVTEMLRPVQSAPGIRAQRGQRRVVALVGGTGSGKTSLAAKLAARYAYEKDLNVALVSMDTYRIAAVDQLRTFADIMGFPLEIAYTADDFARLSDSLHADLVIVDTAGRSPLNSRQLDELQTALAARRPDEVHLAVPATARYDDLALTLEAFGPVQPTATIVTKLDETRTLGMLYNLAQLGGPPVSFFSTGQAIPEDLHEAQPGFLAGWAEGLGYSG